MSATFAEQPCSRAITGKEGPLRQSLDSLVSSGLSDLVESAAITGMTSRGDKPALHRYTFITTTSIVTDSLPASSAR